MKWLKLKTRKNDISVQPTTLKKLSAVRRVDKKRASGRKLKKKPKREKNARQSGEKPEDGKGENVVELFVGF